MYVYMYICIYPIQIHISLNSPGWSDFDFHRRPASSGWLGLDHFITSRWGVIP